MSEIHVARVYASGVFKIEGRDEDEPSFRLSVACDDGETVVVTLTADEIRDLDRLLERVGEDL